MGVTTAVLAYARHQVGRGFTSYGLSERQSDVLDICGAFPVASVDMLTTN